MINESALKAVFEQSLALKKEELCLIITDFIKEDIWIDFFEYAKKITDKAIIHIIEPTGENGKEPDKKTSELMMNNNVIIILTSYSMSHTKARWNAQHNGARIASMPGITEEIINRCLEVDYSWLKEVNKKIMEVLEDSRSVQLKTELGTDITFTIPYVKGENGDYTQKNSGGNLPCGEVDCAIDDCDGKIVFDGSFASIGILDEPIIMDVRGNKAIDIRGKQSKELIDRLDAVGNHAYLLAEFAIGINPNAIITGNVLEDEKVLGTAHIALGNNTTYKGNNNVQIHLDGVIKNPTIIADGKIIMEKGKLLIRSCLIPSIL